MSFINPDDYGITFSEINIKSTPKFLSLSKKVEGQADPADPCSGFSISIETTSTNSGGSNSSNLTDYFNNDDLFIIQKYFDTLYIGSAVFAEIQGDVNLVNSGNLDRIFLNSTYEVDTFSVTRYLPSDDPSVTDGHFPMGNPGDPVIDTPGTNFYNIGINHYLTQNHPNTTSNRHFILGQMTLYGRSTFLDDWIRLTFQSAINAKEAAVNTAPSEIIQSNINGGTAPFTYLWNNGSTSSSINNPSPGSYSLTITDANGCSATSNSLLIQ